MPPPSDHPCLNVLTLSGAWFVRKLKPSELEAAFRKLVENDNEKRFLSITRTDEELSVVGEYQEGATPVEYGEFATWTAFKIAGPMEFNLTGVLAGFVDPLRKKAVPVFAVSTYNTDYVLVPAEKQQLAAQALKEDGWILV